MQHQQKNNLIFFIIFLFLIPVLTAPTCSQAANKLLVMYSNDVRGELEACG